MNNSELQKITDEIQKKLVSAGIPEKDIPGIMQGLTQKMFTDIVNELSETLDDSQKEKIDALSDTPTAEEILSVLGITEEQLTNEYLIRLKIYSENLDENIDTLKTDDKSTSA